MNQNIVPYVPISDRVIASNDKSQLICQHFFKMIDSLVHTQIMFNHETQKGYISISPDQINDLVCELSKVKIDIKPIDIHILNKSLEDLIYPVFIGEKTISSPIWNNVEVKVWQFQLNKITRVNNMILLDEDKDLLLDQALASVRIWRQSLESGNVDQDVIYNSNDLIYKLLDIEQKLARLAD